MEQKKKLSRKIRRRHRGRKGGYENEEKTCIYREARAKSRIGELEVATNNVRTLSLAGKKRAGHAEVILRKYQAVGCNVIGLKETRAGRNKCVAAEYRFFCCGAEGGKGRTRNDGVGLVVKESTTNKAT